MNPQPIYLLGGYQSDFSRNWHREGGTLFGLFSETVQQGLQHTQLDPADIDVGHVGNFVSALYTGQAHLGGFFSHVAPALANIPASSHEAACASGSMALFAAMSDLEAGRYELACVVGIEIMRTLQDAENPKPGDRLRGAAWADKEWQEAEYVWPCAFDQLIDAYDEKFGINKAHLAAISQKNFRNARHNPNAQTRQWAVGEENFSEDDINNPVVSGRIRRYDCGQISDGAAAVFLATRNKALEYAKQRGIRLEDIPQIKGWGHVNAPMLLSTKLQQSSEHSVLFPHIQTLFKQTLARAALQSIEQVDGMEVHDCFNITEYMIADHCGLYQPGEAYKAIEKGDTQLGGRLPMNMSGGLIGLGHPVGATGVRMALDCAKQVNGESQGVQIENARNMMTFNLGGSTTTCASLIIGK